MSTSASTRTRRATMGQKPAPTSRHSPRRLFNPVRAMSRGLAVLEAINELRSADVMELVRLTALPRTTVIRLLETLHAEGYVLRDPNTGAFEPAPRVGLLSSGLNLDAWLVTVTTPKLRQLVDVIRWPSDIMVLQGDRMALRNSNRAYSPVMVDRHFAGMTSPLTTSASGRAYLAWSSAREREKLIGMTTKFAERAALLRELELTRERGYGLRNAATEPRIGAIAVPVLLPNSLLCCVTCIFPPESTTAREVAKVALPALRTTAAEVAEEYRRHFRLR